jgi:hypothetical protein
VERLDHFLISSTFLIGPSTLVSQILPWASPYHKTISLSFLNKKNLIPIPFHFNPFWLDHPFLLSIVHCSWSPWIVGSLVLYLGEEVNQIKNDHKGVGNFLYQGA